MATPAELSRHFALWTDTLRYALSLHVALNEAREALETAKAAVEVSGKLTEMLGFYRSEYEKNRETNETK